MSENKNVNIRSLSAYPKPLAPKTDYQINPNPTLVNFFLCMHHRVDNFKAKVNQKYNATNKFLFHDKVQNLTGLQRLGSLFLLTMLSKKVSPKLPGNIKGVQIKKFSPIITTGVFTGQMFYFFPEFSQNAWNGSKSLVSGKYAQYKEQQAINAQLAKARAEEEAAKQAAAEAAAAEKAKIDESLKTADENTKTLENFGEDPGQSSKEDEDLYTTRDKN